MKLKVNIRECVEANAPAYNDELRVTARIDIDDLFDAIPAEDEIDVAIDELLAQNRKIAHIWGIDDVRQLRADLDDEQAWNVLQTVARRLHYDVGITFDVVDAVAAELYPRIPRQCWQGRIDVRITGTDGCGQAEVLNRLRDMAGELSRRPDVKADADTASLRLIGPAETAGR